MNRNFWMTMCMALTFTMFASCNSSDDDSIYDSGPRFVSYNRSGDDGEIKYIDVKPGESVVVYAYIGTGVNEYYGTLAYWNTNNNSVVAITHNEPGTKTTKSSDGSNLNDRMHVYARLTIKGNENVIDDTTSITVYLQNSGLGMQKWLSIPVHVSLLSNYPEKTFLQDIGGYRFAMLPVKGGTFTMGIRSEESGLKAQDTTAVDDDATHFVHLSDYFVAETEVTKILWHRIMPVDYDIMFDESSDPVNGVTWQHCKDFIAELNKQTGYKYRLLTEAEWEYAARGGVDSKNYMYAGSNYLDEVAWFYENSAVQQYGGPRRNIHNVAEKKPNELGIYDMSGNVSEWCSDRYSAETYLNDHAKGVVTNPKGATDGSLRVIRGGSYLDGRDVFYLSKRNYGEEQGSSPRVGFRLAMSYDDYIEMLKTKKKIYAETHDLK